jgi:hypothetical protein
MFTILTYVVLLLSALTVAVVLFVGLSKIQLI